MACAMVPASGNTCFIGYRMACAPTFGAAKYVVTPGVTLIVIGFLANGALSNLNWLMKLFIRGFDEGVG